MDNALCILEAMRRNSEMSVDTLTRQLAPLFASRMPLIVTGNNCNALFKALGFVEAKEDSMLAFGIPRSVEWFLPSNFMLMQHEDKLYVCTLDGDNKPACYLVDTSITTVYSMVMERHQKQVAP